MYWCVCGVVLSVDYISIRTYILVRVEMLSELEISQPQQARAPLHMCVYILHICVYTLHMCVCKYISVLT